MHQRPSHAFRDTFYFGLGITLAMVIVIPSFFSWGELFVLLREPYFWLVALLVHLVVERLFLLSYQTSESTAEEPLPPQSVALTFPSHWACRVETGAGELYRPDGPPNFFVSLMRVAEDGLHVYLLAVLALPKQITEELTYILDGRVVIRFSGHSSTQYAIDWRLIEPGAAVGEVSEPVRESNYLRTDCIELGPYKLITSFELAKALEHLIMLRHTQGAWLQEQEALEVRSKIEN
jgi:hypothetical protein